MNRHSSIHKIILSSLVALFIFLTIVPATLAASSVLIKNAKTSEKIVSLTIDDGYDRNNYTKILQILDKHGVKATFFVNGQAAENNPNWYEILQQKVMSLEITPIAIPT